MKLVILIGQYMSERYYGRYYAKAQNLARVLRRAYDEALRLVDLLVMPTTPPESYAPVGALHTGTVHRLSPWDDPEYLSL